LRPRQLQQQRWQRRLERPDGKEVAEERQRDETVPEAEHLQQQAEPHWTEEPRAEEALRMGAEQPREQQHR